MTASFTNQNILVTGSSGFIGQHLVRRLRKDGHQVYEANFDVSNREEVSAYLKKIKQLDQVIHLAGISDVKTCENNPETAFSVNVLGTHNLLNTLTTHFKKFHFIFTSTAHVYADSLEPIAETNSLNPVNFYSRTKMMSETLVETYCKRHELSFYIFRLFQHTHHSQSPQFFLPSIYSQIIEAKRKGETLNLKVGNLDLNRDISSIFDLLNAFSLACARDPKSCIANSGVYNICSGVSKNLRSLVESLCKKLECSYTIEVDASRLRQHDPIRLVGSPLKFANQFKWSANESKSEATLTESFLRKLEL